MSVVVKTLTPFTECNVLIEALASLNVSTTVNGTNIITDRHDYQGQQRFVWNGNAYLFSRESYSRFPDIWWADKNFKNQKQITNINPQQNKYAWGTSKLVSWKTYKGEKNEGVLYLPEGYDGEGQLLDISKDPVVGKKGSAGAAIYAPGIGILPLNHLPLMQAPGAGISIKPEGSRFTFANALALQ